MEENKELITEETEIENTEDIETEDFEAMDLPRGTIGFLVGFGLGTLNEKFHPVSKIKSKIGDLKAKRLAKKAEATVADESEMTETEEKKVVELGKKTEKGKKGQN